MLLNVPVKISKKAFNKLVYQASESGYFLKIVAEKDCNSIWIGDVCVGEQIDNAGCWIYPLAFARYDDDKKFKGD